MTFFRSTLHLASLREKLCGLYQREHSFLSGNDAIIIYDLHNTGSFYHLGYPVAQTVKNLPARQETCVRFLGREDPLEQGMATHSTILTWWVTLHRVTKSRTNTANSDSTEMHTQVLWSSLGFYLNTLFLFLHSLRCFLFCETSDHHGLHTKVRFSLIPYIPFNLVILQSLVNAVEICCNV